MPCPLSGGLFLLVPSPSSGGSGLHWWRGLSALLGLFDCLDRDVVSLLHAAVTRVVLASTVQADERVSHCPDLHFLLAALTSRDL